MENSLKSERKKKGLTQEQLAESAGISRQAYIAIEKYKTDPRTSVAMKLARRLGMKIEEFFKLTDKN